MFAKGMRVSIFKDTPTNKRYGVLQDGDCGTVVFVVAKIALIQWDRGPRTNANWGQVNLIKSILEEGTIRCSNCTAHSMRCTICARCVDCCRCDKMGR